MKTEHNSVRHMIIQRNNTKSQMVKVNKIAIVYCHNKAPKPYCQLLPVKLMLYQNVCNIHTFDTRNTVNSVLPVLFTVQIL